ncbi:helix-turn-helix domain-containing protein [Ferrimonas pelagia]|uniref:Helix-turn-helix domain-containing protein n=1 Tax=Ferrimonas pelagia TaxID=1177826 RepID=A0ABP9EVF4_9GAMM
MVQIGQCRYLTQQKRLLNSQGESWELPRAEAQVLTCLLDHPNKPVDKKTLRCGSFDHPQFSESAVVRAVFQLRNFLQDDDHTLIETVKGVGYCLMQTPQPAQTAPATEPVAPPAKRRWPLAGKRTIFGLALIVTVLAALWLWVKPGPFEPHPAALKQINHSLPSGEVVELLWHSPASGHLRQDHLSEQIQAAADACSEFPWQQIYLSVAADQQGLAVTLAGRVQGQLRSRNLKISDTRSQADFNPSQWLNDGGLCDQ